MKNKELIMAKKAVKGKIDDVIADAKAAHGADVEEA